MKMKTLSIMGILFLYSIICYAGLFNSKPKPPEPGTKPQVEEVVLQATEKSYQIDEEIKIKTNKGRVIFNNNFYIVSKENITIDDRNQNDLLKMLPQLIELKKNNQTLKVTTYVSSILAFVFFIFVISLIKKKA